MFLPHLACSLPVFEMLANALFLLQAKAFIILALSENVPAGLARVQ